MLSHQGKDVKTGWRLVQAGLWETIEGQLRENPTDAAKNLLERLLVPGQISPKALSLALEELGKPISAKHSQNAVQSPDRQFFARGTLKPQH